ncbi:MAG: TIM44-like domain-containing protein [Elusimicrobiota bacterium]
MLFVLAHPLIGLPLTLLIVYASWQVYGQADPVLATSGQMHQAISRGLEYQDSRRLSGALETIKKRDPGFNPAGFLSRAGQAFLAVQSAWSRQDLSPARAFVSDGVMERFLIQIEMQKSLGERNAMSQVQIQSADIVEAESDPYFDALHVRFAASAEDEMVSLSDGHEIPGLRGFGDFVEIWSFLRRPGVKTLSRPGLIEGACPNCGAPLPIADAAQCPACKSWVNSGEYDWVLCGITQESEWSPLGSGQTIPGFVDLSAKDPALNPRFLEDRASVAFWRWQMALFEGKSEAMAAIAAPEFCRSLQIDIAAQGASYREAAVGSCEIRCVETGGPMDKIHVLIKWAGDFYLGSGAKAVMKDKVFRQHVFILERKNGAVTQSKAGLSSARCPDCGAPVSRRDAVACEYCGAPFNDGRRQWVVSQILPVALWTPPAAVLRQAPETIGEDWVKGLSAAEVLTLAAVVVSANGRRSPRTDQMMSALGRRCGVPQDKIPSLLDAAAGGHVQMPVPKTPAEAQACLRGISRIILANGPISRAEAKLLNEFGRRCGFSYADVRRIFRGERVSLYRQSKAALDGP